MDPSNAERREILRAQHAMLRKTIDRARAAARGAAERHTWTGQLQAAIISLEGELLAHLHEEERLLEPILPTLDAWGSLRLTLLRAEHAHQRAVLAALTGQDAWPAPQLVASRTLTLCDDLLTDMEFEERELLNDRVLRDDPILLDASDC